ncbi:hypothetical protein ACJMK2_044073 [Sinanodonta woodiana]|uniref:Uncharacterized protein n=1 Tax=Sinanodonta woodiana TaxID=1069815 RepID=A0ABD3VZP4_SINWO
MIIIRHRYNYDPDISSGDESIQDFIDDDEQVLSDISDTDSESTEQTRKRRITNYHPRIKTESCSEEDSDEERKSGASSSEVSSCHHLNTNSRSFTKKRKYTSQGNSLNTEKESKEEDFGSMVPVKTSVKRANKHESSDTEPYSDSSEYVPKSQGSKKRNSADAAVSDTESESVSMHALSSESEQNLTKKKSKVHTLDQLQNDSRKNNLDMAAVKEADLNPVRPIDEHSELTRNANYVSEGDVGESAEESVNESNDDGEIIRSTHKRQSLVIDSDSDDGEIIRSTHKQQSLVIDSDSDAEEFSDPATSSSIRKSNRSEDQMKMKSEARKNLFKEFKAARKRSLSGDIT